MAVPHSFFFNICENKTGSVSWEPAARQDGWAGHTRSTLLSRRYLCVGVGVGVGGWVGMTVCDCVCVCVCV